MIATTILPPIQIRQCDDDGSPMDLLKQTRSAHMCRHRRQQNHSAKRGRGLPILRAPHVSSSCSQRASTKSTFLLLSVTSVTSASALNSRSTLTIPEPSVSCSLQSSAYGRSNNSQKHRALRGLSCHNYGSTPTVRSGVFMIPFSAPIFMVNYVLVSCFSESCRQ